MPAELTSSDYQEAVITISHDSAVVVERRIVSLPENLTRIKLQNFPRQIITSTLHFQSKTDPLTFVEYQVKQDPLIKFKTAFDLKSASKRLYGQRVSVKTETDYVVGYFVALDENKIIIRVPEDDGETKLSFFTFGKGVEVSIVDKTQTPNFEEDEKNYEYHYLSDVRTSQPGDHTVDVHYSTGGISAEVSYVLQVNESEGTFKLVGDITVSNYSGKSYDNATVYLAFDRDDLPTPYRSKEAKSGNFFSKGGPRSKVLTKSQNRSIFPAEGKKLSLPNKSQIQYSFFSRTFPIKYYYLLKTLETLPVDVISIEDNYTTLNFELIKVFAIENNPENNLGLFFPKGKCDVFIYGSAEENSPPSDSKSASEHVNEELELNEVKKSPVNPNIGSALHTWHTTFIYPTNNDEPVEIPISSSSSIKACKSKKSFKKDERKGSIVESFQITVTNKQEKAAVIVEDTLFRCSNWELSKVTPANYYSVGSYNVRWEFPEFNVGEAQDIRYTVTYNYTGGEQQAVNANNANNNVNNNNQIEDEKEKGEGGEEKKDEHSSFFSKIFSSKSKKQKA